MRPWRSSGDDPGKGAESRAPWAPCEAANGAGSPPPSPAFAAISFCYATRTLSVPAPQAPPFRKNSRPVISARPEKTASLVQGGGNPRPRGKLQNPESWSSPAPAEMGGRRDWCPCCEANDGDAQSRPTGRV